jgi:hypothetical protein
MWFFRFAGKFISGDVTHLMTIYLGTEEALNATLSVSIDSTNR